MLSTTLISLLVLSTSTIGALRVDVAIDKSNSIRALADYSSVKSSCTDRPLDERQRDADAVLSGTVRRLDPEHLVRHGGGEVSNWRARVEVKRIIKGENIVSRLSNRDVASDASFVWIVGIGDQRICKSLVRLHDTKIFMVKLVGDELRLNSSIVRVTLDNIEHADAIAHSESALVLLLYIYVCVCVCLMCVFSCSEHAESWRTTKKCLRKVQCERHPAIWSFGVLATYSRLYIEPNRASI